MAIPLEQLMARHEGHETGEDDDTSDVIVAKSVAMVVLFFASLIFGCLPMLLSKKFNWMGDGKSAADIKSSNKWVVALLSFGGGVLLCTTFQHLLPEVGENIQELQHDCILPELPFHLESVLMCTGFFIMYLVEESVHFYLHSRANRKALPDASLVRTLSVRHSRNHNHNNNNGINNGKPPTISTTDLIAKDPEKSTETISTVSVPENNHNHSHNGHSHDHSHDHKHSHSHIPVMGVDDDPVIASLRGLLVVLALSVHELFEGLSVGLESSASQVWYMFGAVSAHKLVIAFCVGVELVATGTKKKLAFIYVFTFAIVSPLGIGIGLALAGGGGAAASGLPSVILQGIASGTLLYVVFFEILQRDKAGFIQFGGALVGYLVMFGLQFLTGHEHSHGGHETPDCHEGHTHP